MTDPERSHSFRMRSIRAKLLAYATAVLVVPTLAYGILTFTTARHELEPPLRHQLADAGVTVKIALQELLAGHVQNVKTWAHLDIMRELVFHDIDKTVSRFLEDVKRDYGVYLDVLVVDDTGVCHAASAPRYIGKSYADAMASFFGESGDPVPAVAYSADHRTSYIGLAATVPDPDKPERRLGTMLAMLDSAALDVVFRPRAGQGRVELLLLDENRRVIATSSQTKRTMNRPLWHVDATDRLSGGNGRPLLYSAWSRDGKELVVSEVPLTAHRALPGLGWTVVATLPQSVALAPVRTVRDRVLLFGSAVTLVGLLLAWLLSSNISRPIKELTRITTHIADEGVLATIPEPRSQDEVGELTRSFQTMVKNVAEAHDEVVQSAKLAFLGEMAAGMAHEIRTPLGIIKNSAQLLERRIAKTNDEEGVEFARFIYEESDRLNATLRELLDFARPSPLDKAPIDPNRIVERAVQFLSSEAASKSISLGATLGKSLPAIECDSAQVYQVLLNLVMNAIHACASGGKVEISTKLVPGGIEMAVTDNGPGIPDEILDKLFTPFVSQRAGGIGLGLAIVKRIVTAHAGRIEAMNQKDGGAAFTVWLPLSPGREGTLEQ